MQEKYLLCFIYFNNLETIVRARNHGLKIKFGKTHLNLFSPNLGLPNLGWLNEEKEKTVSPPTLHCVTTLCDCDGLIVIF